MSSQTAEIEWRTARNPKLNINWHFAYSEKKQQRVFFGPEVAKALGHSNLTQSIKASGLIKDKDYVIVRKKNHPEFFEQLTNLKLVGSQTSSITMIYETGVDLLTLTSRLEKGKVLRRWLADEVLPNLRTKGYFPRYGEAAVPSLEEHTNHNIQRLSSKRVNSYYYKKGGVSKVIDYNQKSCALLTGKLPKEVRAEAKKRGLPSRHCQSAKAALRIIQPEAACTMSLIDNIVAGGVDFGKVMHLAVGHAMPLYREMIKLGVYPPELKQV